jgi:hypothetical protein
MATLKDYFPSNYIRPEDLNGRDLVVTIDRVESVEFENDGKKQLKPVAHFRNEGIKPLVCNKTNFLLISGICGENTDDWPGKQIRLFPDMVAFKGQIKEAIRVKRLPQAPVMANEAHTVAAAAQAPFATAPAAAVSPPEKNPDNDIPN